MMHNVRSWFNFLFVSMEAHYQKKKQRVFMFSQLNEETRWKNWKLVKYALICYFSVYLATIQNNMDKP